MRDNHPMRVIATMLGCLAVAGCGGSGGSLDPNALWDVSVASISVAAREPDGSEWDVGGSAPDPYVACYIDSQPLGSTVTISDSYTGINGTIICSGVTTTDLLDGRVVMDAWDRDLTSDDLIGIVPSPKASDFGRSGTASLATSQGVATGSTLNVTISRHP